MNPVTSSSVAELAQNGEGFETDASKVAEHQEYADALSMSGRGRKRIWSRRSCDVRKVISVGAIFIALLLVIGAIYMHLNQKHRLGRLNIPPKKNEDFNVVTAAGVAAQTITTFQPSTSQPSAECLACIATTATNNVPATCTNRGRGKEPCGIYRISYDYWQDTLGLIHPEDSLAQDYKECVVDRECAERIVRSYVERYDWDCNGDGRIECRDHVILHMRGPGGCRRRESLEDEHKSRMEKCFKYMDII
uniref:lysozyme n=1 Tax=Drosophila rhopaloa TaxID=1041015 RepID=A0A6P4E6Q9_DRORH